MLKNDSLTIIEQYKRRLAGHTIDQLRYKSRGRRLYICNFLR